MFYLRRSSILKQQPQSPLFSSNDQKFSDLLMEGTKPLLKVHSVFPFDFFPDALIIDPIKVTHVHKVFFASEQIKSILFQNMKYCILENAPLFSTMKISDKMLQPTTIIIKPMWKKQATKAHDLIQGLIVTTQQQVDTTRIIPQQEIKHLQQLGKSQE